MSTTLETDPDGAAALTRDLEHFIHAPGGRPKVATGAGDETLREVLVRMEVIRQDADGLHVFVGECIEALDEADEIEDGIDAHEPVDIDMTLAVLEIHRHRHVHVHQCRHVEVTVHFGGNSKRHRFVPNATIGVATDWARRKFHLDAPVAGEYVLQLVDSKVQPRSDEHLGDVVHGDTCSLEFDLVKEVTPKG